VSIHHHSEGWLEPEFKRFFRKLIESTTDFVFTGHEHEQDYHLEEDQFGAHLVHIEADALQDADNPKKSGFNAVVIDFEAKTHKYFLFRWKQDQYYTLVDGVERPLVLTPKGTGRFLPNPKFAQFLVEEDFGFTHPKKGPIKLPDLYVYPGIIIQDPSSNKSTKVSGANLFEHILKTRYLFCRGGDLSGKTSLMKTLYRDFHSSTSIVPVLIGGEVITSGKEEAFFRTVWSAVRAQYSEESVESFKLLPPERRCLLVDDWHESRLRPDLLKHLLVMAKTYFGMIVISTSAILSISDGYELKAGSSAGPLMQSGILNEMSPSARGELIEKWLKLGQEESFDPFLHSRSVEEEQGIIDSLISRFSLPSLPYLIIGVLQTRDHQANEVADDPGSFGYLVQKLVIDALSVAKGSRRLIERKDLILRRFAFRLFSSGQNTATIREFETVVEKFGFDQKVKADPNELLNDLLLGRVLEDIDGNLSFKFRYYSACLAVWLYSRICG
jgi:hypothetical protein